MQPICAGNMNKKELLLTLEVTQRCMAWGLPYTDRQLSGLIMACQKCFVPFPQGTLHAFVNRHVLVGHAHHVIPLGNKIVLWSAMNKLNIVYQE